MKLLIFKTINSTSLKFNTVFIKEQIFISYHERLNQYGCHIILLSRVHKKKKNIASLSSLQNGFVHFVFILR